MINVNELRLGNKIKMPYLGNVVLTVFGIAVRDNMQVYIQAISKSKTIFFEYPEKYEPIPLTDEILQKIDIPFKIIKHHKHDDIYVMFFGQESILMNYLHELQNIIFLLTKQELTFIE